MAGALRFARYAFPPNRLGYCGPEDHDALFHYVSGGQVADRGLVELARRFDGAFPYLALIAGANRIRDPFDLRVVEAYWIGNGYLDRVAPQSFYDSLRERFRSRMEARTFDWLASTLAHGAVPHHNFHVFDVYRRAGLMNDRTAPVLVSTMDRCRISWGKVVAASEDHLTVERLPLVLAGGKLALGEPEVTSALRQLNGSGFVAGARPGDVVSVHWDWACEVLTAAALNSLRHRTMRALELANTTV